MAGEKRVWSREKTMAAGAKPKVMLSAKESSSLPMAEETRSKRAAKPSKKSKRAPMTMKRNAA